MTLYLIVSTIFPHKTHFFIYVKNDFNETEIDIWRHTRVAKTNSSSVMSFAISSSSHNIIYKKLKSSHRGKNYDEKKAYHILEMYPSVISVYYK